MPSAIDILDPFNRIQPGPFISKYSDWIIFSLLIFFFWSVAGIALRKQYEDSRHLKALITTLAMLLAVSTYYSIYRGWLHLSLKGLGHFGALLLFVVVFFVVFGLLRGYGMTMANALPLGFSLFYLGMWAVSPNILNNFAEIFPPANGILLLFFIASVIKVILAFFSHSSSSPLALAKDLRKVRFTTTDDAEIDREISEARSEKKQVKKSMMKLTRLEINTLGDIENCLEEMTRIIAAKGNRIDEQEIEQLRENLKQITKKENLLKRGLETTKANVKGRRETQLRDVGELQKRLAKTKDKKKRKTIEDEIASRTFILQALDFIEKNEKNILGFSTRFNQLLSAAMQGLQGRYPVDALSYLKHARKGLSQMKGVYEKQQALEESIAKLNKKTLKGLKKEKK
ncbi:hypothetical protein ACFL0Q_01990 [Thermodesulfobacteriota bacterium]